MRKCLITFFLFLLSMNSAACWDHSKSDKWNRKECHRLAKEGDPHALMNLGDGYFRGGNGFYPNHRKALYYFKKVAEMDSMGASGAQFYIGRIYAKGKYGVKKDTEKAVEWFERAIKNKERGVEFSLISLYYSDPSARDYVQAYKWAVIAEGRGYDAGNQLRRLDDKLSAAEKKKAVRMAKEWLQNNAP